MGQTFGISVPRIAINSEPVHFALLALSAISLNMKSPDSSESQANKEATYLVSLAETRRYQNPATALNERALSVALRRACYFISNISKTWRDPRVDGNRDICLLGELFLQEPDLNLMSPIYWLLLRLGMLQPPGILNRRTQNNWL